MNQVPANLYQLEYPTPTSVKLDWSIDGDTPVTITVQDLCSELMLATVDGDNGGTVTIGNMPVNQQYRLCLLSNYTGQSIQSNVLDRYAGKPCATPKPAPVPFPQLQFNRLPKTLTDTNKVVVTCVNGNLFSYWQITADGYQQGDQLAPSEPFQFPSSPQLPFTIAGDGYTSTGSSGWGLTISGKGIANYNSVGDFLKASGVDGTGGLLTFMKSANIGSVRILLGI
jgi:hypothetical protein